MTQKIPKSVRLLDRSTVSELLTLDDCISAVEAGFVAHAAGSSLPPKLMHLGGVGGEFHIKAGGIKANDSYFACKINGGFFNNKSRLGIPNISGIILLFDGASGTLLAAMDSAHVTQLRTGAVTAIAAKYLARRQSHFATICGAGTQGEIQLRALTRALPLKHAWVWSRSAANPFAARMSNELGIEVEATTDLVSATTQSDVIVTCTSAHHWFLGRQHVNPGTFVAAIGADSPDKQELEPELLSGSSVICDLVEQCAIAGDLKHAIARGLMGVAEVRGELAQVIAGQAPGRTNAQEIIIFDSTGTAIQDVAAAAMVYERAQVAGRGQSFAF
jgi:alanine dehydrogenase